MASGEAGDEQRTKFFEALICEYVCKISSVQGRSGVAVVRAHGALFFALPVAFFLGVALVVFLLAARQADFDFDLVTFPVHGDGHEGVALALDGADELVDLDRKSVV